MGVLSEEEYYELFPKKYPPSTERVYFLTKDNKVHYGFFLRDINKYIRNVKRWKDTDRNTWFDDKEVVEWSYSKEVIEYVAEQQKEEA